MKQYFEMMRHILTNGVRKSDRTGTGTTSVFGYQMRFNLTEGFPLITTKKIFLKGVIYELLWFLRGDTNIKYLRDNGVSIWNEWADNEGNLGPVYGYQWRHWPVFNFVPGHAGADNEWVPEGYVSSEIDQITKVVERIKARPDDRRLIVSAWNVADVDKMKLPPCHCLFQFYVADGKLSCLLYQRSCDTFLGVPFNIASYALLTMMVAQTCGLGLGEFVWTGGDVHIYSNHMEQVSTQLSRELRALPTMRLNPAVNDLFGFKYEDFTLEGYDPHPAIKAPVAV